ncbi:MAG: hypothetical protein JWO38_6954 [Gemmataceae bacterium]|nr:hypothetical protein [Gemmataceae bacterium]
MTALVRLAADGSRFTQKPLHDPATRAVVGTRPEVVEDDRVIAPGILESVRENRQPIERSANVDADRERRGG